MLHLAMKAFYPSKPPFPLMHIATGWDFRDMIVHRDVLTRALGLKLIVQSNEAGDGRGPHAVQHRQPRMGTDDAHRCLEGRDGRQRLRCRLRRRPARRGEEPGQGARLFGPLGRPRLGSQEPAAGALAALQQPHREGRDHPRLPALQLDRVRHLGVHPAGGDPGGAALFRQASADGRPRRHADHGRRRPHGVPAGRGGEGPSGAVPHAGRLAALRGHRVGRRHGGAGDRRDAGGADVRAPGPPGRHDEAASMEKKKREGYF
jgi:hypothetical protein